MDDPMQAVFMIGRSLNIELKIVLKMHFHQVLVVNFGPAFMTQVMQSNDPFFLPIIAYIGHVWTIHVFVTYEMKFFWKYIYIQNIVKRKEDCDR